MSSDKEIGAPYTLASLPHPLDSISGRTQAAGVYSLSGTKKRKRTEIAVGVDGEGILIYSLQNPQLVTSYALPPQTSFSTAPYSLYRKGTIKRGSRRFTYASVKQSTPRGKPQLVCFLEDTKKDATTDTVKSSYTITNSTDRIIAIDSVPVSAGDSAREPSHDILAFFANGDVICLSSDLEVVRWNANIRSLAPTDILSGAQVEHTTLSTARTVNRGLLRNRADVAAALDPSLEGKSDLLDLTQVLCVIARQSDGGRTLSLFHVQSRSPDLSIAHLPPLNHLLTWPLPSASALSIPDTATSSYSIHSQSGTLHQLVHGTLVSYDLSGTVPKIHSETSIADSHLDSFLRVSPDLLLTVSRESCRLLDVKFNSIQASLSLEPLTASNESKKRKLSEPSFTAGSDVTLGLVTYFAESGLAVGVVNHELIGIQLGEAVTRKRSKTESTLINAIGKGIPPRSSETGHATSGPISTKESQEWQRWQARTAKLNRYASKGKMAKFEELFAAELGIELGPELREENETSTTPLEHNKEKPLTNGVAPAAADSPSEMNDDDPEQTLRKWQLPQVIPDAQRYRHRHHASYALSRIFRFEETQSPEGQIQLLLRIEFFPPNVFEWLLLSGHVTKEAIRRALSGSLPQRLELDLSVSDGDIVKAIVEFDPDLQLLSSILNHGHFLPIGEVVHAIKLLIQSIDDHPKADNLVGLLTNGSALSDNEMDLDFACELEAATHEVDHALSILDHGLVIRSYTLRPALIRLHTFPASIISTTLRSILPRRDLELLIQLLQSELRNGGWTSPYDFIDPEVSRLENAPEDPDDHAVAIIASLLSCTLDAMGPGAWLTAMGGSSLDEATGETIWSLHEDASEALNGFWEARYMRGLLSEFLRYATNVSKSQKPTSKDLQKQGKPFAVDMLSHETLPMLPLGAKVDLGIEKTKSGKGGRKEERSAREIGMLISKRVPKYSFERIEI
ncbi:hypothetical protein BDV95DRAFT_666869 [Massariosphaeria phaeospora]|uniref:Utp8 beta-propeller domain-containing protein n=1 Tax=Massariosphaeria phaeospora TaxID=100035 RepID=A0A7C8ICN7_9PLEO|nr:hypothetical protein BDV95DRAFT_666869 [Massariosphaeria phaeospora]